MFHFGANPSIYPHLRQSGGSESLLWHISGSPSFAYWSKRSPGLPMLINGTGLFEYGAMHFSYAIETYTVHYGALHFSYILGGIVEASIESAATATGSFSGSATFSSLVAASAGAAATTFSAGKTVEGEIAAAGTAQGVMVGNQTLNALIESAVEAVFFVRIAGQTYPVWAVNAETFAASRYENYNFNSFAKIGGFDLAGNEDGLYSLEGDDDAGTRIDASFMLGRDRLGSERVKRSRHVYLHGTSDEKMELRVIADDGEIYTYKTELALSSNITSQRVVVGRGLNAHYWQLEVRNTAGGQFEIEQIEVVSLHTGRKIKR